MKQLMFIALALLLAACEKPALDQNDNIIKEKVFENVPVTRNQVTRYTGSFFGSGGSGGSSDGTFRMTADPEWDSVNGYSF